MSKNTSHSADFIGSRKLEHPEDIQRFIVTSEANGEGRADYAIAIQQNGNVLEVTMNEDEFANVVRLLNQAWEQVNNHPFFD